MAEQQPDPRYVAAWRQYRRWLIIELTATFGLFIAGDVAVSVFVRAKGRPVSGAEGAPFIVAWFVLSFGAYLRLLWWKCPRCGRQFFMNVIRNPFARRCMHCGLPKWSRSPGADQPVVVFNLPPGAFDVEAEIRFLTYPEGGRQRPVFSGYRAQLFYDGRDWDAVYGFIERDLVRPGDTAIAHMWLLSPDAHRGKLVPGKSFVVREGQKVVAKGVVTRGQLT